VSDARPPDIRVGLCGYGVAGAVFHAPLIASTPGLRLAAIVTGDPGRKEEARRAYPGARILARADELWENAGDLDLAVIATPNATHAELALSALDAGLAVVVDKPLAASAADARRVIDAAARLGRPLTVFQNRRWDGDFLTVRRLLADGTLGAVHRFESRFERWRPTIRAGWKERATPGAAGGVLFDLGSHLVDQALQLFGPVAAVHAELDRRRPGAEVDDDSFVALTHASGVRSHLWMSLVAAQPGPRLRVLGDRGAYVKHGLDPQEDALRAGARPGGGDWGAEPPARHGELVVEGASRRVPTEPGNYPRFYSLLLAALRDGALPPAVDPRDSLAVLEIIERAQRGSTAA